MMWITCLLYTSDYAAGEEPSPKRNKVVNINSTMQLQVVLVKPEQFEDASAVADHLNAKRTVCLLYTSARHMSHVFPGKT